MCRVGRGRKSIDLKKIIDILVYKFVENGMQAVIWRFFIRTVDIDRIERSPHIINLNDPSSILFGEYYRYYRYYLTINLNADLYFRWDKRMILNFWPHADGKNNLFRC